MLKLNVIVKFSKMVTNILEPEQVDYVYVLLDTHTPAIKLATVDTLTSQLANKSPDTFTFEQQNQL